VNERKRRIGENEAIFRSVNEQVRELTASLATATNTMKVVCECGARSCTDQFEITTDAYGQVRADSTVFVVKPGHDLPETETVIDKNDTYWTVREDPGIPTAIRPSDGSERVMRYLGRGRRSWTPSESLRRRAIASIPHRPLSVPERVLDLRDCSRLGFVAATGGRGY